MSESVVKKDNDYININKKESQLYELWKRFRRNKLAIGGLIFIILLCIVIVFQNQIAIEGVNDQNYDNVLSAPSSDHFFGTDQYGRDIFSRIVYGAQYTIIMGLIASGISTVIGVPIGAITGYYGGKIDAILMRIIDVMMTLPNILLALVMTASLGPGFVNTMIAVGIAGVPGMARISRSAVMSVRNQEFVEAAISNNASDFRIISRYVMPNSIAPIIVQYTMLVAGAILTGSSLSFLGFGLQPPAPEWGAMLSAGKVYMREAWWLTTIPGVLIMSVVLAINLIGDGLRDALDPKQKR